MRKKFLAISVIALIFYITACGGKCRFQYTAAQAGCFEKHGKKFIIFNSAGNYNATAAALAKARYNKIAGTGLDLVSDRNICEEGFSGTWINGIDESCE